MQKQEPLNLQNSSADLYTVNFKRMSESIKLTYREALKQALREALLTNEQVFLMGEDVGHYGGAFAISKGLLEEFGADRIMDVPLSESGFVGAGIGAALNGMRPVVEVMTVNFSLLAMDQLFNNAATLSHMSGGQFSVPVVVRMGCGIGRQLAAQHSHSWEPFFAHVPGLIVLSAGTHQDARGMLLAALEQQNPVILFEYTFLLNMEAELAADAGKVDISKAKVLRSGNDISIITYGGSVHKCMMAAMELEKLGIDAEVVDLRVLRPLDEATVLASVAKTHKVLIVEEAWQSVSISSEISARIMEKAFYELDAPVQRLCGLEVPIPYPKHLEEASVPQVNDIVQRVKKILQHD
jgi:pyruvate dehydrogenase E1 component beta subunit